MKMRLEFNEKLNIIKTEYHIPIEDSLRKDVSVMCNLSQGIREDANAEFIMRMYKKAIRWNRLHMWQRKAWMK